MKNKFWTRLLDVIIVVLMNICIIAVGIWLTVIPIAKSENYYFTKFKNNEDAIMYVEDHYPNNNTDEMLKKIGNLNVEYFFGNLKEYQLVDDNGNIILDIYNNPLYNENEMKHMKDVKDLFIVGQIAGVICLMGLIGCSFYLVFHFRRLRKTIIITTASFYAGLIILIAAFLLWGYMDYLNDPDRIYNPYFIYVFFNFHKIIFFYDYDKYLLATSQGPYQYALTTMVTFLDTNFFMEIGIIIGIVTLIIILLWIGIIITYYILYPKIIKKVEKIHERTNNVNQTEYTS